MDQNEKIFDPGDKGQLRDFINEIITERFLEIQRKQERSPYV
jgi:hypothetical protein